MSEFTLRAASPVDHSAISSLMEVFNREEGIEWRPDSMLPALDRLLREPSIGIVVVAADRENGAHGSSRTSTERSIVGYGLATFGFDIEYSGRDAFVTELFVHSAHRGAGIGRALLAEIVDRLRELDAKAVHLFVRPGNERAKALYESLDFREVPRLIMTRRLDREE